MPINRLNLNWVALREAGVQTEFDTSRLPDIGVFTQQQVEEIKDRAAVFRVPAQLAVEIVSKSSVKQDYQDKVLEYANKGIPEYWIIDPISNKITVCVLIKGFYQQQEFINDELIVSRTFPTLTLTATQVMAA